MCHVFFNVCIYAKQKINLTWPYGEGYILQFQAEVTHKIH